MEPFIMSTDPRIATIARERTADILRENPREKAVGYYVERGTDRTIEWVIVVTSAGRYYYNPRDPELCMRASLIHSL